MAYDILMQSWDMNKIELIEQFAILLLDRSKRCLGFQPYQAAASPLVSLTLKSFLPLR